MKYILLAINAVTLIATIYLIKKTNTMATRQERHDTALQKIDAATTDIANDLRKLKEEIQAGNVSEESITKLEANAAALDALGKETPNEDDQPQG